MVETSNLAIDIITTATAISFPNTQIFNVEETLQTIKSNHKPQDQELFEELNIGNQTEGRKWEVKLIHRDKFSISHIPRNHSHRFHSRMHRDIKRVAFLARRLSAAADYKIDDFGSDVVSGTDQGSGEYFIRIGVGSPPRSQYMVIDSGSDIVWVQCKPCTQCYRQFDPLFDPAASASYSGVPCSSMVCNRIEKPGCHYGDGSFTKGNLALETLTFGRTVVQNVAIGCEHTNRGMFRSDSEKESTRTTRRLCFTHLEPPALAREW